MPTIRPGYFGLPTMEGTEHLGVSSPEIPALQKPDPLSITIAGTISSTMKLQLLYRKNLKIYYKLKKKFNH